MTPDEYQKRTLETAVYRTHFKKAIVETPITVDQWLGLAYCAGKLNGEAGEVAEEVFKALRDDAAILTAERQEKIFAELGDVCWYVANICNELNFKLGDVMDYNLTKLADRKSRDKLHGSGDNR